MSDGLMTQVSGHGAPASPRERGEAREKHDDKVLETDSNSSQARKRDTADQARKKPTEKGLKNWSIKESLRGGSHARKRDHYRPYKGDEGSEKVSKLSAWQGTRKFVIIGTALGKAAIGQ